MVKSRFTIDTQQKNVFIKYFFQKLLSGGVLWKKCFLNFRKTCRKHLIFDKGFKNAFLIERFWWLLLFFIKCDQNFMKLRCITIS